ncbi:Two-component sensor histidine kinase, malate [Leuconostoc inhae]|uniref:histidine kinase n=2 Tax=Leuconostoc TaxID=1243 RepID=A0AAN2QWX3_9LACO|nr:MULTISPECIES: ATP-binding protein [Leuconostoc]CBL90978.1 Histidine protein kinase, sensor protein [Leuconostoc gasicomitatum LMG 18811]MBZ5947454.1 Spo0B domain-containing protein [Leuconostoc gasicomitatum]MBZ5956984.1 Spo0B domain-containing protein [Leuconostoc gasicomitatum]MBZ5958370.1 Spo0B domain-containing protein [Leuconostoc gasicomitatum]MBZ5960520.1 Spo0B domain-containing protein [Leuconostoc gasicomitatum]
MMYKRGEFGVKQIKNIPLYVIIIGIVVMATVISLGTTGILLQQVIEKNERENINLRLKSTAQIAASDPIIIRGLSLNASKSDKSSVQIYAQRLANTANIDFVVVVNDDLYRLSHPNDKQIGKKFSSPQDARQTLQGKAHFSTKVGVLGLGYRYFDPVYDANHDIIGLVSVGLTEDTIARSIKTARRPIFVGLTVGLLIGIVGAIFLAKWIKKILLDMEPYVIAKKLVEKNTIENSMMEGLLAIDDQQTIIAKNMAADQLLPGIGNIGDHLPVEIFQTFFVVPEKNSDTHPNRVLFKTRAYLYSVAQLVSPAVGSLLLFRDITDFKEIVAELDGTKQYAQALRAQTHEFMNKLQAITGLIELKKYDEVNKLIPQLTSDYQQNIGYIMARVKMPVIAGFLIGKVNYAHEHEIILNIGESSCLPKLDILRREVTNIIKILGNIIDNAVDALSDSDIAQKKIDLLLRYDDEGETLVITIEDNGAGIASDQFSNILTIGFSTKGHGRGFGLTTVNAIITDHQGVFDIQSTLNIGTKVYIEYPLRSRRSM